MVFVLVFALLAIISVAFSLFSTSVTLELNVAVCKQEVKLVLAANPLISGIFLSRVSILFSKVVTSDASLAFRTKLLVSTALSFVISPKLSKVFLVTPAI